MNKESIKKKFYWHANTSSGGTLSLMVDFDGDFTKEEREKSLASAIDQCCEFMEKKGYIPLKSNLLSSRDIAGKYGKTRQYWEKLLNEGKILYKETSAGRITTDLWVEGYLRNKEEVDRYVKNVRGVIDSIGKLDSNFSTTKCPVCQKKDFDFAVNGDRNINGICRSCGFHVHTTN